MAREKVVVAELYDLSTQVDDLYVPVGGNSGTGTSVPLSSNPLVGDRLWDNAAVSSFVPVSSGSWSIELQGTVAGITGFVLAENKRIGIDGVSNFALFNTCKSSSLPTPTHVLFDETAAGGITASVNVFAKTYRGSLSNGPSNSFRVVEGIMYASAELSADTTVDLSTNPPSGGTFGNFMGLDKYTLWDACNFYVEATTVTGTWDVDVVGRMGGQTVCIARTGSAQLPGATGVIAGATKMGLQNQFNGPVPRPSQIIFTEVGAGAATFRVAVIAKAHRGQRFKI